KNHISYRELYDYDIYMTIDYLSNMQDNHPAVCIAKRIHHRKMPKIIRLDHADIPQVEAMVNELKSTRKDIQDWQVALIRTPHQSYKKEADPILVVNERDEVKPINEI